MTVPFLSREGTKGGRTHQIVCQWPNACSAAKYFFRPHHTLACLAVLSIHVFQGEERNTPLPDLWWQLILLQNKGSQMLKSNMPDPFNPLTPGVRGESGQPMFQRCLSNVYGHLKNTTVITTKARPGNCSQYYISNIHFCLQTIILSNSL